MTIGFKTHVLLTLLGGFERIVLENIVDSQGNVLGGRQTYIFRTTPLKRTEETTTE